MPKLSPSAAGRPNTLNLAQRELERLLDRFDTSESELSAAVERQRQFVRRPFRCVSVRMTIEQPGGGVSTFAVACRNLSRRGAGRGGRC